MLAYNLSTTDDPQVSSFSDDPVGLLNGKRDPNGTPPWMIWGPNSLEYLDMPGNPGAVMLQGKIVYNGKGASAALFKGDSVTDTLWIQVTATSSMGGSPAVADFGTTQTYTSDGTTWS
jgi:hypothetical protein